MNERKRFFKKLKKEGYTILFPNMLPTHFELFAEIFKKFGYKAEVLLDEGREIKDEGLKNIHNDACYPALIVTGSFISALKSGKYDLNKTAVIMSQTGGGCRASNYIFLIRKALQSTFPQVPCISLNASGLEKEMSFPFTPRLLLDFFYALMYGDLIMLCYNQTKPYEKIKNQADEIQANCFKDLRHQIRNGGFSHLKKNYKMIVNRFSKIEIPDKRKPRVGVVGEIFVKYSALANNHLLDFLIQEGTEPNVPSLLEFLLYCLANNEEDFILYGHHKVSHRFVKIAYKFLYKQSLRMNKALKGTKFIPYEDFEEIKANAEKIISRGVKMGEGWLIPAEMLTMAEHGVKNIVCAQPFGCLPNHIVGKGMVRPIKELHPEVNIAPIDYDPGATKVNQENRIKLMLSNIKE